MSANSSDTKPRRYRKRVRARREAETRLRITMAAVDLHGSVGPARTTVAAIAERAGVQRATVYRHFPDDEALFAACSAHWRALNPPPDPAAWRSIPDPDDRSRVALREIYRYYAANEAMLANVTRDEPLVPAIARPMSARRAYLDAAADVLARGRPERGAAGRRVRALIRHALDFATWRSLTGDGALADDEAADVMASAARAAD